jgi:SAM-dependent methyltransferase
MGYVFNRKDAIEYDQWFKNPDNRLFSNLEKKLMIEMLKPARRETVLDIGCGNGESLIPFLETGLSATGIDPSQDMLDSASGRLGNRVELHRGFAEDLPFDDNSFNYAAFFTSLEFVDNPEKAVQEACRVAKDKIFIGFLNSFSINFINVRAKGVFFESVYRHARFFNVWELKRIIRNILGDVPVSWSTVNRFSYPAQIIAEKLDKINIANKYPFGSFAGIVVTLVPRFRTTALPITYPKRTSSAVAG